MQFDQDLCYSPREFVCIEVLWHSQSYRVMSSTVSLSSHILTGQALSSKWLTSIVHILSPETDNCLSWISGRERMTSRTCIQLSHWGLRQTSLPTVITLSSGTDKHLQTVLPQIRYHRMRHLIRVYTVWHTYSNILDTSSGSIMEYFKF